LRTYRSREVIVSAGGLHSPAILLRAGIGPAGDLQKLGIPVLADRRGVGANLQNHPVLNLAAHLRASARQSIHLRPLSYNSFRFSSGLEDCPPGDMFMVISNRTAWHAAGRCMASLGVAAYKVYSRGSVTLFSADASREPHVRFDLLSDYRDRLRLTAGLRVAWRLINTSNVRGLTNDLFVPTAADLIRDLNRPTVSNRIKAYALSLLFDGPAALRRRLIARIAASPAELIDDDEALEDFVYRYTGAMFHPSGTCRIGAPADRDAVVDPQCKVIGTSGLRVVDGSVMPTIVRGNINIPIIMIAEKASDMILA
jgi:5-(hydroxymethyl)furfural/furfural oxidase